MGEIVDFRRRQPAPAAAMNPSMTWSDDDEPDHSLMQEAYGAAFAAAERYERERRKEREMQARLDALTRENARLKAELAQRS